MERYARTTSSTPHTSATLGVPTFLPPSLACVLIFLLLPRRERPRRATASTHTDPFTLLVAPDAAGVATGGLYLDAYDGYAHEQGGSRRVHFAFAADTLLVAPEPSKPSAPPEPPAATSFVERIVFLAQAAPRRGLVRRSNTAGGAPAESVEALVRFDAAAGTLTVRQPGVRVGEAFSVELIEL